MDKIRIGLIRCDTHGAYFGALMAEHDPLRLRSPLDDPTKKRYTWQLGAAYFYFYTHYCQQAQMTVPFVGGFEMQSTLSKHYNHYVYKLTLQKFV